jgi:hypothetical protein
MAELRALRPGEFPRVVFLNTVVETTKHVFYVSRLIRYAVTHRHLRLDN